MNRPVYSFVIPVFNEEETLPELAQRLRDVLTRLDGPAEVIFVDDGSTDHSFALLAAASAHDPRFKVLRLSRNFGHQLAITAGLDHAAGDAAIVMDADLQDPPEVVLSLAERWRAGFSVVFAVRRARRGESAFKRWSAGLFYRLLRRLTDIDIPPDVGDFRLVDRKALVAFRALRERDRYVRGLFSWIGLSQTSVEFTRAERFAGRTKYPLRRMLKLAADGVFSFSQAPLRAVLKLGFLISGAAFCAGAAAIALKVLGAYAVSGWTSMMVVIFFLGGIQLTVVGVIGQYIGRIYEEVKRRPLYVVDERLGLACPESSAVGDAAPTALDRTH